MLYHLEKNFSLWSFYTASFSMVDWKWSINKCIEWPLVLDGSYLYIAYLPKYGSSNRRHQVSDLISPSREWNIPLIFSLFSTEMMSLIYKISIVKNEWSDQLMWGTTLSNHIKLIEIYPVIWHNCLNAKGIMSWAWKMKVPLRIKFFWWKVLWNWLPCKDLLVKKGNINETMVSCDLCSGSYEDMDHELIICLFLAACWSQAGDLISTDLLLLGIVS